jgi:hypothetical protein
LAQGPHTAGEQVQVRPIEHTPDRQSLQLRLALQVFPSATYGAQIGLASEVSQ